jgi:hypothetical protein
MSHPTAMAVADGRLVFKSHDVYMFSTHRISVSTLNYKEEQG